MLGKHFWDLGAVFSFLKDGCMGYRLRRVMIFIFIFFVEGGWGGVLGVLIGGGGKCFVFLPEWVGPSF